MLLDPTLSALTYFADPIYSKIIDIASPLAHLETGLDRSIVHVFYHLWSSFFYHLLPVGALICAIILPFLGNPVHSLLALIGCFFAAAVLLIANGAEFLGYLFLIVYIGAIAILFLFVVMLLNVNQLTARPTLDTTKFVRPHYLFTIFSGGALTLKFLVDLFDALLDAAVAAAAQKPPLFGPGEFGTRLTTYVNTSLLDIYPFATSLYTTQSALLVVASFLLLSAMLGAIVLAVSNAEKS